MNSILARPAVKKGVGVLRLLTGISLLVFLLYKADLKSLGTITEPVISGFLVIGLVVIVFSFLIMALRLHVMVLKMSPFHITLRQFLIGWFFSNILPTNFGGDGYLIYYYKEKAGSIAGITMIVTFQRIMGILILLIYALIFNLINPGYFTKVISKLDLSFKSDVGLYVILIFFAVAVIIFFYLLFRKVIVNFLLKYVRELRNITGREFMYTLLLSVAYQLFRLAGYYLLLRSFGCDVNPFSLFFVLVLVTLISMLPVSVGGLGVQESVFAVGLSILGVPVPIAVVVSLLNRGVFILMALLGGGIFLLDKKKNQPAGP